MANLPTGTLTFLFTDIEDSTRLASAMGDEAWAEVLEWHRRVIRDAVGQHGGVEFGTEGDACFVAFPAASGALAAAVAAQRALALGESTVRVRMGLHSGEALVRGTNYVGQALHFAKRICDAGHGRQILLSAVAAGLVGTHLPSLVTLRDLGRHRLKDLGESQSIREAVDARLPCSFPPLRTLDARPNSLPAQRSALVGRSGEVAQVSGMLDAHRLVTLTGIGGCGKTRLALAVAAERADIHLDGVFFVDLAPVGDPSAIATTVATALGLSGGGSVAPIDAQIDGFLSSRSCLIVFDNCEHMLDECAEWVERMLGVGAGIVVIATSREALGVDGEQSFRVPSLSTSTSAGSETSDAVVLFVDRARAVDPSFTLTPDVVGSVIEITRRLDGIPLAIEFAAARVSHLTPADIAARLDDMFRLLTGGRRRVQRQQTLKAALDWSYELLTDAERQLLQRLAVFNGGAHFDAVEAIWSDSGEALARHDMLDMLGSLVAKSLVIAQRSAEHVRYHLLETVRQYAAEELRADGSPDLFRSRHLEHYSAWLRSIPLVELYFDIATWMLVDGELDNLRSAMTWSVEQDRPELAAHIASLMFTLGSANLFVEEARRWLLGGLERLDGLEPLDRQAVLAALATAEMLAGDGNPVALARRAVEVDLGNTEPGGAACVAHTLLSTLLAAQAQASASTDQADESRAAGVRALDIAGRLDDPAWTAWAWQGRGNADLIRGDMAAAAQAYERAIEYWAASTCTHPDYVARFGLAVALHIAGDGARATTAVDAMDAMDALDVAASKLHARRLGEQMSWTPMARTLTLAAARDLEGARTALGEALRSIEGSASRPRDATLITAAVVALEIGDCERASRLLAAATAFDLRPERTFFIRSQWGFALYRHYLPIVRASLAPDIARRCRAEGAAMSTSDAMAHAWELTTV